jgi:hypothetical protein
VKVTTKHEVSTSFKDTTAFQIEASAKAFQILSGNIYTDVLLAIIRELSANAWDAHFVKGNTDVPFELTVPTALKPELIIKDYGVGLSEKAMMTLYKTYFGSDKTLTDELIGGLGLGSKTPFAYTDTFTVVSRFGGMAKTYACFLNDKRVPGIIKVSEEPHEDDTGLTIIIPCQETKEVKDRLHVLRWYPTTPKVHGGAIPDAGAIKYEDSDVTVTEDPDATYWYKKARIFVVMGHVPYKVGDIDNVKFAHSYYFREPIGTYEPAASRESLTDANPEIYAKEVKLLEQKYVENIVSLIKDPKLTDMELLRLARQNWSILSSNGRVEAIRKKIDTILDTYEGVLRNYKIGRNDNVSCIKEGKDKWRQNRWQINRDVFFESICIYVSQKSTLNIVSMPPGTMHCKMVKEHFEDDVDSVITIESEKYQEIRDELDAILGNGICTVSDDWPVSKKTTTRKAPRQKYTTDSYGDIYLEKGYGAESVDFGDVINYDPNDYYVLHYSRRSCSPRNHWAHAEVKAGARLMPCKGILWVPDTQLLKAKFEKLGFVLLEDGFVRDWPEVSHLHTDYQALESTVHNAFHQEQSTLFGWDNSASKKKQHRLLTIGHAKFKDLRLLSKFSSFASYYGRDEARPTGTDEQYKRNMVRFLARFKHRYPQHRDYNGKKLNEYMRYQDYERTY